MFTIMIKFQFITIMYSVDKCIFIKHLSIILSFKYQAQYKISIIKLTLILLKTSIATIITSLSL